MTFFTSSISRVTTLLFPLLLLNIYAFRPLPLVNFVSPQNPYVKALTPEAVIRLNVVIRTGPKSNRAGALIEKEESSFLVFAAQRRVSSKVPHDTLY